MSYICFQVKAEKPTVLPKLDALWKSPGNILQRRLKMPEVIVGTIVLYALIIIYTRIFGLKSFSKMTGFDF
jgi:hypothetical protein